jgi:hypothetical protein
MKSAKIIGSIIVALLGAFGSYTGYKASQKTDAQAIIVANEIKALMTQMNTLIIPQIQKGINDIRTDVKENMQDGSADRERIARLEAIIEILSRHHDRKKLAREAKAVKIDSYKPAMLLHTKSITLPMLQQRKQIP